MAKLVLICLYEPEYIGSRVLVNYVLKHGHDVRLLHLKKDCREYRNFALEKHHDYQWVQEGKVAHLREDAGFGITEQEYSLLEKMLQEEQPDIIGISARSLYNHLMPKLISVFRKAVPTAFCIAGGYGPTLSTAYYLETGFDAVIRGEGEEPLLAFVNAIAKKENWKTVHNLSYLENGKLMENPMQAQCRDLDTYEAPYYGDEHCSYIDGNEYIKGYDVQKDTETYNTLLGRGCVGKCSYCCAGQWFDQYAKDNHKVFRRRNRSLESIFHELKQIDRRYYKYIIFCDEMFVAPYPELKEFFIRYKKEIALPFFMYFSYEYVLKHPDLFELAFEAGWSYTGIGIQSGSRRIVHDFYGRNNKNEDYIHYAKKLFENNVAAELHMIGGNCYEEEEDFNATLALLKELPFSIIDPKKSNLLYVRLKVLPKTKLCTIAPRIVTEPMPAKVWLYRAALAHLVRITTDEQFEELRNITLYKDQPDLLLALYRDMLAKKQYAYFKQLTEENEGKSILFYGAGDLFKHNKSFFKGCKIEAILLDKEYIGDKKQVDKIPVVPVDKIGEFDTKCPIIAMSGSSMVLQQKLERQYHVERKRIHATSICIPTW